MAHVPPDLIFALRAASRIGLAAHARPDGDAIGSTVALAESLLAAGKQVIALNEDGVPTNLAFVDAGNIVQRPSGRLDLDMVVVLDTSTKQRLGDQVCEAFASTALTWCVDHHVSNENFCSHNWVQADAAATGTMVFDLIRAADLPMPEVTRDALFVAISTDTGNFQYPNTTAETMRVAAELVEAGADPGALNQAIQTYPFRRIEAIGELLTTLEMSGEGRVASWALTMETKQRLKLESGDTEGLTDLLRGVDTVLATVLFDETESRVIRVSARSKDRRLSVADVCARFGGGGHRLAAGARVALPLVEAREVFLQALHEEIQRLS